ncbi:MAG: DUF2934 domain-containing protein [Chloroflexi bacterium]|nr:DUF2934 domain-containing protein [Chloroflexota bacterium]
MQREEEIRQIAERLWETEGRPGGRAIEHWTQAETMVDLAQAFSKQSEELARQLEIKDRQIELKDRQIEDRAREIAQLHELLARASALSGLSAPVPTRQRRSWWKRLVGSGSSASGEEAATAS